MVIPQNFEVPQSFLNPAKTFAKALFLVAHKILVVRKLQMVFFFDQILQMVILFLFSVKLVLHTLNFFLVLHSI